MLGILYAIASICLIVWIAGLFLHLLGGAIHIFIVVAIILFVVGLLRGKASA